MLMELEYIAIVCLIIYVGAIAILFLFVIMLLNLRVSALKNANTQFFPLVLLFCVLFMCFFILYCNSSFTNIVNTKAFLEFIGF
jgi:NADH:ubiquinone oxidoreductase subunit 6 (subunit J)